MEIRLTEVLQARGTGVNRGRAVRPKLVVDATRTSDLVEAPA